MSNGGLITASLDKATAARLLKQLDLLTFSPRKKYDLMRKAGREVRKYSAKRVREQVDIDGKPFTPRKRPRFNKKKDSGWSKSKKVFPTIGKVKEMAVYREGEGMAVSWKRGKTYHLATIANFHQQGNTQTQTVTKEMREGVEMLRHKRPTRKMAKVLIGLGYRRRVKSEKKGKKRYKTTIKGITEEMSFFQCAWLIRMLKHGDVSKEHPKKMKQRQSWSITTPKRSFLGVTEQEGSELLEMVSKEVLKHLYT